MKSGGIVEIFGQQCHQQRCHHCKSSSRRSNRMSLQRTSTSIHLPRATMFKLKKSLALMLLHATFHLAHKLRAPPVQTNMIQKFSIATLWRRQLLNRSSVIRAGTDWAQDKCKNSVTRSGRVAKKSKLHDSADDAKNTFWNINGQLQFLCFLFLYSVDNILEIRGY